MAYCLPRAQQLVHYSSMCHFNADTYVYQCAGIREDGFSTVTIFEAGVALTVVGVVVTIILSISEDE